MRLSDSPKLYSCRLVAFNASAQMTLRADSPAALPIYQSMGYSRPVCWPGFFVFDDKDPSAPPLVVLPHEPPCWRSEPPKSP